MSKTKTILIGCDNAVNLSALLHSLRDTEYLFYNILTASRLSDLKTIATTASTDLMILNFNDCQQAINECAYTNNKVPVICLANSSEVAALTWGENQMVFVYPFEYVSLDNYLARRLNSIFLLQSSFKFEAKETSLAGASLQASQSRSNRELSCKVLELDQKMEVLSKVKEQIVGLFPRVNDSIRSELTFIVNAIRNTANDNNLWDDFKSYFVKTNPNFLLMLAKKYPALTQIDIKYCCYLKMNMSNDEIRSLLGINQESVRTHKYRLKKKMSLGKEQSLRTYLQAVG